MGIQVTMNTVARIYINKTTKHFRRFLPVIKSVSARYVTRARVRTNSVEYVGVT